MTMFYTNLLCTCASIKCMERLNENTEFVRKHVGMTQGIELFSVSQHSLHFVFTGLERLLNVISLAIK